MYIYDNDINLTDLPMDCLYFVDQDKYVLQNYKDINFCAWIFHMWHTSIIVVPMQEMLWP